MLKPLCVSLAFTAFGASTLGADEASPDISTWRWRVSALVEPQPADANPAAAAGFAQKYERYSINGVPDAPDGRNKK